MNEFIDNFNTVGDIDLAIKLLKEKRDELTAEDMAKEMTSIKDSIGSAAAEVLFDAIENCDFVECSKADFLKDSCPEVGDINERFAAGFKAMYPDVYNAIPKGAKILDSVAKVIGINDTEYNVDRESGFVWGAEPIRNDVTEVEGWTEAQDKFNACDDNCAIVIESDDGSQMYTYVKFDGLMIKGVPYNNGFRIMTLISGYNKDGKWHYPKKLNTTELDNPKLDLRAVFYHPIPKDLEDKVINYLIENDDRLYDPKYPENEYAQLSLMRRNVVRDSAVEYIKEGDDLWIANIGNDHEARKLAKRKEVDFEGLMNKREKPSDFKYKVVRDSIKDAKNESIHGFKEAVDLFNRSDDAVIYLMRNGQYEDAYFKFVGKVYHVDIDPSTGELSNKQVSYSADFEVDDRLIDEYEVFTKQLNIKPKQ